MPANSATKTRLKEVVRLISAGKVSNASHLAEMLAVNVTTVRKYLDILAGQGYEIATVYARAGEPQKMIFTKTPKGG